MSYGFPCGHAGCTFLGETAARRSGHERSMNSHEDHFRQCKATCATCQRMLQTGEWNDLATLQEQWEVDAAEAPAEVVAFHSCSHVGCTYRLASDKHISAAIDSHEHSIRKHYKHFLKDGANCPCCAALLQVGIWTVGDQGNLVDELSRIRGRRAGHSSLAACVPDVDDRSEGSSEPSSDYSSASADSKKTLVAISTPFSAGETPSLDHLTQMDRKPDLSLLVGCARVAA